MQKKIFLTVIALFAATAVFSQVRYQGHLAAGYGIQIGWADANPINVETTHGVRINPHLFTGAGIGLDYRSSLGALDYHVYGNVRGYLLAEGATPFLSVDAGYGFLENDEGFYASPALGMSWPLGNRCALAFNIGFQMQDVAERLGGRRYEKNVIFRVEFMF